MNWLSADIAFGLGFLALGLVFLLFASTVARLLMRWDPRQLTLASATSLVRVVGIALLVAGAISTLVVIYNLVT